MKVNRVELAGLLRRAGNRATPHRIALLGALQKAKQPLSPEALVKQLGNRVDRVTVYRALDALVESGLVRRVDLGHAHAHYEFQESGRHHHHLICRGCGKIEDVAVCGADRLEPQVLRASKGFRRIDDHALEFFGYCRSCET